MCTPEVWRPFTIQKWYALLTAHSNTIGYVSACKFFQVVQKPTYLAENYIPSSKILIP